MTEKNILQNWFVTGAKPTQEQFWAWQESYWHKSESIPTEKILGLSEVLANKADVEILQHKANLDTSNLTNEHVLAWKKALGVGELPSNIATIDEGEKHGNVYTKEEIDQILSEDLEAKADRTEVSTKANADASQLTAENITKWKEALGVGGQVAIEPMGLAYADQTIPKGVTRTIDTTGAKLQISGLRDINGDRSFSKRLRMNDRGELAVSDEVEWAVNIPEAVLVNLPADATCRLFIGKKKLTGEGAEHLPCELNSLGDEALLR